MSLAGAQFGRMDEVTVVACFAKMQIIDNVVQIVAFGGQAEALQAHAIARFLQEWRVGDQMLDVVLLRQLCCRGQHNTASSGRPWPAAFWPVWAVWAMAAAEALVRRLGACSI